MNIYCIYADSSKNHDKLLIVKQGFDFYAAIFTLLWALYHRMWLVVVFATSFNILTYAAEGSQLYYICEIAILLIFGFFAGDLREYYATQNGFSLVNIIVARNEEDAELKHYYINLTAKQG